MCIEKQEFKVEVNLSFEEFREQKIDRFYWSKLPNLIGLLLRLGILIVYIILFIVGKKVLTELIFWIVLIALEPLFRYLGSKRLYNRTVDNSYSISDCGVMCYRDASEASLIYKWNDIRKVEEYNVAFVFYPCITAGFEESFIIPKMCFSDEGEIQMVKELLEKSVKKYRVKVKLNIGGNDGR